MIGHLDCSTGASGDKLLGALLDIGERTGEFTAEDLRRLVAGLAPEVRITLERVRSHGIAAVSVRVDSSEPPAHRHWRDIEALLRDAGLPEPVRTLALRTFAALAAAEAHVHGVAVADVHFHEVGAVDSIADIVGACAGVHALGIDRLVVGPVAVGGGTAETSHGRLAVPAPATAMLLASVPIHGGPVDSELTTPTGAALVKALAAGFGPLPALAIEHVGFGAGTRDIGMPNVCQLVVGAPLEHDGADAPELVALLETNIDHLTAEELAFAAEELLGGGALDVWQTPIVMKKGRSAVMLSVLAPARRAEEFAERIIDLTGSLGVRRDLLERTAVDRESRVVDTPWGPARVKLGAGRVRPEHEDVARIAREHALPYRAVAEQIERIAREAGG